MYRRSCGYIEKGSWKFYNVYKEVDLVHVYTSYKKMKHIQMFRPFI